MLVDANNLIKINHEYLEKINEMDNSLKYFGEWTHNVDLIKTSFLNASPFEHIVINDFLTDEYANRLYSLFPENFDNWYKYENPIEVKYAYDDIDELDEPLRDYFYHLSSNKMVEIFRRLTNIEDLTYDEYLHGAGLHSQPRYGRLNIHLDYEKHPLTGKERRLNIILFLTKNWEKEWGGQNELWDKELTKCVAKTDIKFNRAIIFKTNDISWHGLPKPITCPEGNYRKTLAFYYVSPLKTIKDEVNYRKKAKYVITDKNVTDNGLLKLCEIRSNRRLTRDDVNIYYPDWKKEDI